LHPLGVEGENGQGRSRDVEIVDGGEDISHLAGHPDSVVGGEACPSLDEVQHDEGLGHDAAGVVERAWRRNGDAVSVEAAKQFELDAKGQGVSLRVGAPSASHDEPMPAAVGSFDLDRGHPRRQPAE